MRKVLVLAAVAALVVPATGCGCFGKARSWFHKGSPCGTRVAPAALGAPITMTAPVAPMMTAPMVMAPQAPCVQQAPMCMPCNPCGDPCSMPCGDYSTGYVGDTMGSGCAACDANSGGVVYDESTYLPPGAVPVAPDGSSGAAEPPRYADPTPMN